MASPKILPRASKRFSKSRKLKWKEQSSLISSLLTHKYLSEVACKGKDLLVDLQTAVALIFAEGPGFELESRVSPSLALLSAKKVSNLSCDSPPLRGSFKSARFRVRTHAGPRQTSSRGDH